MYLCGNRAKNFIDCGGVERKETVVNFQLWEAGDYDHRLAPQKFLRILDISKKVLGEAEKLDIEVEYQQSTIGKRYHQLKVNKTHRKCLKTDNIIGVPNTRLGPCIRMRIVRVLVRE